MCNNVSINGPSLPYNLNNSNLINILHYITAVNCVLRLFPGLIRADLSILLILHSYNASLSFAYLHDQHNVNMAQTGYGDYAGIIVRLTESGYINRKRIGRNVGYTITDLGRKVLYQFATVLEAKVKERILQFAK